MTKRYVEGFRVPKSVGSGRVLKHNHVRHTINQPCGVNGFRAWTDDKPFPGFHRCGCGWSGLPHYSAMPRGYKSDTAAAIKKATGVYIPAA
jgi:hypothetical protein